MINLAEYGTMVESTTYCNSECSKVCVDYKKFGDCVITVTDEGYAFKRHIYRYDAKTSSYVLDKEDRVLSPSSVYLSTAGVDYDASAVYVISKDTTGIISYTSDSFIYMYRKGETTFGLTISNENAAVVNETNDTIRIYKFSDGQLIDFSNLLEKYTITDFGFIYEDDKDKIDVTRTNGFKLTITRSGRNKYVVNDSGVEFTIDILDKSFNGNRYQDVSVKKKYSNTNMSITEVEGLQDSSFVLRSVYPAYSVEDKDLYRYNFGQVWCYEETRYVDGIIFTSKTDIYYVEDPIKLLELLNQ